MDCLTSKQRKLEQLYKANEVIYEEEESPDRHSSSRTSFRFHRNLRVHTEDGLLPDSLDGTPLNFHEKQSPEQEQLLSIIEPEEFDP